MCVIGGPVTVNRTVPTAATRAPRSAGRRDAAPAPSLAAPPASVSPACSNAPAGGTVGTAPMR